jgi:hypothetical protein
MTKYPTIKSEKVLFRELFDSTSSVIDNGGTLSGVAVISNGSYTGTAAITDAVRYGDPVKLKKVFGKLTVGIRFRTTQATGNHYMFAKYFTAGDGMFYLWHVASSNRVDVVFQNNVGGHTVGTGTITGLSVADGEWHSAVGVYDGTNVTVYVDGVAGATVGALTGDLYQTTKNLYVGSVSDSSSSTWVGDLKDSFISSRAFTADEVLDWHEQDTFSEIDDSKTLISLPMRTQYNDGTQKTVNIGSLGGTVTVGDGSTGTTYPTQLNPQGMSFDGGDYLKSATVTSMSGDFNGSFSILIKSGSTSTDVPISLGADTSDPRASFGISINSGGVVGSFGAEFNSATHRTAGGLVNYEQWNHLVVTKTAGTITAGTKLYLNGEEIAAAATNANTPSLQAGPFNVGNWVTGMGSTYDGTILYPKLWDFVLTQTQVKELARREMKGINK